MPAYDIPFYKESPFVRICASFITGIIIYNYLHWDRMFYTAAIASSAGSLLLFSFLQLGWQYRLRYINGILVSVMIAGMGSLIASIKDPYKAIERVKTAKDDGLYIVSLQEPPQEKKSTYKALAKIEAIHHRSESISPETNIILYFKKGTNLILPPYGTTLEFSNQPVRIKNFMGVSSFDYENYCALKNIHYQVFLKPSDFTILDNSGGNAFNRFLFQSQQWIVAVLQKYIKGKKESGLAEALLIGYKNNLDRDLIQSYSNTGVVHVVAISGLHLGLIYALLKFGCRIIGTTSGGKLFRAITILSGLWIFTLLAGASPSVMRSAAMFTFIVAGDFVSKRSLLVNNLAASAFFLLLINPYWLWDLGFILSYAALLSIIIFMKPIYHIYISENKILDSVWKLTAVTIAAQILTMPVLIYYFHQLPTLFVFTNLLAIPLSSIILIGAIALCVLSFASPIAIVLGKVLSTLIAWMNSIVLYADSFPFSTVKGLNVSFVQLVLVYIFIACVLLVVLQPFKATR
jgi:competence protein ComEC